MKRRMSQPTINFNKRKRRRGRYSAARSIRKKKTALTKFVKNVIDHKAMCSEPVGHYTKTYGMEMPNPAGLANSDVVYVGGTRSGGNIAPYTTFGMAFLPNCYKKLLDAASVLFKNKTPAINFEDTATNSFDTKLLKLDVMYASYKLNITNNTQQVYWVTCVEVENHDSTQVNYVDTASAVANSQKWGGNVLTNGIPTILKANNEYNVPMPLKFSMYEGLQHKYKVNVIWEKVLRPGDQAQYIDVMQQQCVDFQKHNAVNTSDLASYAKGQKQVMFRFRTKTLNSFSSTAFTASHHGLQNAAYGFAVDCTETYKILQPNLVEAANEADLRVLFVDYNDVETENGRFYICNDNQQFQEAVGPKS